MILDGRNIVISCNSPLYLLQYVVSNTITAIKQQIMDISFGLFFDRYVD
jgi:hypothetical protein